MPPKKITTVTPTITPTTTPHIKNNNTESLKKLITAKHLTESPTIKGDANMLIDLETGDLIAKKPSGVDNLLQRLIATNKHKKPKTTETVNILSTENGKLEMSKIQIHHLDAETDSNKEKKPGAAYFKLKENLKSIINNKRREDMLRKQEEEREHNKCFDDDEEDYEEYDPETKLKNKDKETETEEDLLDDEENELGINDEEDILEAENESDDENIPHDQNDDEVDGGADNDDDDLENNKNDMDEDNIEDNINDEDGTDDDENESNENGKRKNRIIQPFQDDSDDDDIDLLKTPKMPLYSAKTAELFNIGPKRNLLDDEQNELLAFDITTQVSNTPLISQMPRTQYNNDNDNTDELLELCSGTFDDNEDDGIEGISGITRTQATTTKTQTKEQPLEETIENVTSKCTKIVSSDEENNDRNEQQTTQRIKKLTKRIKKTTAKLGFSDDEDEEAESEQNVSGVEAEGSELDEEIPETFIDYDSEENEIVVEMTKKDRRMKAQNFVENEAELSESDWGSADEDEKNLDRYDIELGDEDEFDREKLQTELGQIHARKMLDEDIREVRKIQEMLFEDEEQDGVGRQRQFKWKNAESGFSLDDAKREGEGDVDATQNGDSGDEESEHLWRKVRFEREQLLKEQRLKEDSLLMDATHTMSTTTATISAAGSVKKINIITAKKAVTTSTTKATTSSLNAKKNSPFLISKCASAMHKKTVRGSFLVRDKEILNKLAGLTKGNNSNGINDHDTAVTVSVKDAKAKNFVFATLTEEEHETLKRKADDLINSSNENGINYMKKPRVEPRREKCFIDQLL